MMSIFDKVLLAITAGNVAVRAVIYYVNLIIMISDSIKKEFISAGNTFLATFVTTVGAMLSVGSIEWTYAFWAAIGIAAVRAGVKAVTAYFISTRLGGKKEE